MYIREIAAVVRGHTVDISESGISAMLRVEVPVGEVVRLEFQLPLGDVDVLALVRQRSAFRYGFQFVDINSSHDRNWSHLPSAFDGTYRDGRITLSPLPLPPSTTGYATSTLTVCIPKVVRAV